MPALRTTPTADQERQYREASAAVAMAVRLPDSDRLWMAHAPSAARDLTRDPDFEDDVSDPDDDFVSRPTLPMTPAYRAYLARIESTHWVQHRAKNRCV